MGETTFKLGDNDIVPNNRNYTRVIGYAVDDVIYFSSALSATPTQWGIYQPGQYYQPPLLLSQPEFWPVSRSSWGRISIWYTASSIDRMAEAAGREQYTLRDAFPIASVISVLLGKIAPGITHEATTAYSAFLYGTNPISQIAQYLFITPKSNIISAGYDQPAQKAPITLKQVLDMLRDCFRCYWFIDDNKFKIEHILYFENGGSYSDTPGIGINLTQEIVTRNNKPWAFARSQYEFDKPVMAARYQFGWMDDVTTQFEGFPIDILSKYVNQENIEEVRVAHFTSDIDYILLNPNDISKDGFVLLVALYNAGSQAETFNANSYTKRDRWINTETGLWGTSTAYKHILIPVVAGQKIQITAKSGYSAQLAWLTSNAASVAGGMPNYVPGTTIIHQSAATTKTYTVPNGALYMYVYCGQPDYPYIPEYMGRLGVPAHYYLPYLDYFYNNTHHILQNAYAAFMYLQMFYAYDMPARQYAINGVQMTALGIKKLKTQTLNFPAYTDPNLVELVKTNLGNGMIQKLSINLSSRTANATLKYDTEQ